MQSTASTVVILGTGGTIAGASAQPGDDMNYTAAQWGVAQLVAAVPGLAAPLECEQVAQLDSKDMSPAVWQRLAERVACHLLRPEVAGVVVTHGTDTLEETAYFLQRVLAPIKPVVLTAAMRPATAHAPDGPGNLRDAVTLARCPMAGGVLAVLAGAVHAGRAVRKVHPTRLDAFGSGEDGPLARVAQGEVHWLRMALDGVPTEVPEEVPEEVSTDVFALGLLPGDGRDWPRVELVCSHAGADGFAVRALCAAGVNGLVVVGTGNGSVHQLLETALCEAQAGGVAVLRSTRCTEGPMRGRASDALPMATALTPAQARIELLLQLLLR